MFFMFSPFIKRIRVVLINNRILIFADAAETFVENINGRRRCKRRIGLYETKRSLKSIFG